MSALITSTTGRDIHVVWEHVVAPDAAERLAAAFDMLLSDAAGSRDHRSDSLDKIITRSTITGPHPQ